MFASFSRGSLLALTVGAMCFPSTSQAADVAPSPRPVPFTAFPELKAYEPAEDRWFVLPQLPPDASPLRKIRHAQATAAFLYLAHMSEPARSASWMVSDLLETVSMTCEGYYLAAEVEDTLANRVPWYEERVRAMKSLERFIEERIQRGVQPLHSLNFTRFFRYKTEADLLRLKAEVAKTDNTRNRPLIAKRRYAFLRDTKSPTYTAFPELHALVEREGLSEKNPFAEKKDDPWAGLPELDATPSPLQKVQYAGAMAGRAYCFRQCEIIRIGSWAAFYSAISIFKNVAELSFAIANLEALANRVFRYERILVVLKTFERYTNIRIELGVDPRSSGDLIAFCRLDAEARLLQLKDKITKSGTKPTPPGNRTPIVINGELIDDNSPEIPSTAFPELKPPTIELREFKNPDNRQYFGYVETGAGPLPPLPTLTPDASPLRQVLLAQVREGLAYLDYMKNLMSIGNWNQAFFHEYLRMTNDVFRVAAELEPTKQRSWYETRVRQLKFIEHFMLLRVRKGFAPSHALDLASFIRLQAEVDLLGLKAEVKPVQQPLAALICQPVYCPPACVCPRPRVFPRLFRR